MENNALKIRTAQITPTFRFGRSLTQDKSDVDLNYNWPYDYFSIIESAKINASVSLEKPADVEVDEPQISGLSPRAQLATPTAATKVKASTATTIPKANTVVVGKSQKKVSVTKKSNVASKTVKGMKFSKVIKF